MRFLLTGLLLTLTGCSFTDYRPGFSVSESHPLANERLSESAYESLLMEYMITNQLYDTQTDSATLDSAHLALFSAFGTTKELFFATHRAYEQDPETQLERITRLREEVQREMEAISDYIQEQNRARQTQP